MFCKKKTATMECTISNEPRDWSVSQTLTNGYSVSITHFPDSRVPGRVMIAYGGRGDYSYIWLTEENLREFCEKMASANGSTVHVTPTPDYVGGLIRFHNFVMPEVREFFRGR